MVWNRKTQDFLFEFLSENGLKKEKIILFNGSNNSKETKEIYKQWIENTTNKSNSKSANIRMALIDYFKDTAEIMIATEAGAEGVNMQFSSMVINYDLPWNPQRIEQRIGRCHRYGQKNDVIVINGGIAEHGMAILNARENLKFTSKIKSDCRSLNFEVQRCLAASPKISIMRDLTRGGLATVLNEIAHSSNLGVEIYEKDIPIKPAVAKMCDILGFDPLYVANEGKFVCFVSGKDGIKIKRAMGKGAKVIGQVTSTHKKEVYLKTKIGSSRILPVLESDQLPRIC